MSIGFNSDARLTHSRTNIAKRGVWVLPRLLEQAGARLAGRNRADCPECNSKRTVSYSDELYCCHHAGCEFRGCAFTLAKRLGLLSPPVSRAEAAAFFRERAEARLAAEYVQARLMAERFRLREAHRSLLRIYDGAAKQLNVSREHARAWAALAYALSQLLGVRAELTILEDAPVAERLAFLNASDERRKEMAERVILAGGLLDARRKFVEVSL